MKSMRLREVEKALKSCGCKVITDKGPHTKWACPCGEHIAAVPRHQDVSPGVVRNIVEHLACLPKGWLQ